MPSNPFHVTHTKNCELCGKPFEKGQLLFDARLRTGQWGTVCAVCHASHGVGLGLGRGQMYHAGEEEKVAG